ncbi:MAG: hypothetical protein M3Q07_13920, partial [Pseudobdellovibrionaceae bacterium]|nr:hypothetical protein [Pseudobdellovibrionaceae bacterium]
MLHRAASALSLSLIGFALAWHAASAIAQNRPGTSDPVSVDLVADAGFEQGVTGFEMRDGGDIQVSTSRPLVGRSSLQARFATGSSELWFESRLDTATQRVASVKASARIRNDASRNVDFSICASAYDSNWALVRACTPYHLTPGQTVEASAALVFPAPQVLERAFLVIDNESQAALDLTLDEAHLVMVYQTIAGGTNPGPTDPLPNPDPNPAEDLVVNPGPLPAITAHPRLWITAQDLPRLRSWAHAGNPMFQALVQYAGSIKAEMIAGRIPSGDIGGATWVGDPSESYATLFAFLSLLEADPVQAKDWAMRARTLLMHVMDR